MSFARRAGERMNRRGIGELQTASSSAINFAALFPGAYQVVQTDRGLTYGGTMNPTTGNTSSATMALTGALGSAPVPIWLVLTGSGSTGDIYYDGLGVTPAMVGVSVVAGVPIALTGAGAGLSITPSAGTLVPPDSWKATCAALADQSGNGMHYTQATATQQPVLGVGQNSKASLVFDGVNDILVSALALAEPAVTPYAMWGVLRQNTWVDGRALAGSLIGVLLYQTSAVGPSPTIQNRSTGGIGPGNAGAALGSWVEMEIEKRGLGSDPFKLGATTVLGAINPAAPAQANLALGGLASGSPGFSSTLELLAFAYAPIPASWAAIRAAATAHYGGGVLV